MELRGGFRFVPAGQDERKTNLPEPVRGSKAKGTEPINQTIKNESIMAILVNPIQRPNPLDKDAAKKWYVVQVTVDSVI